MSRYTKSHLDTMLGETDYNSLYNKLEEINTIWDSALHRASKDGFEGSNTNTAKRIADKIRHKMGVYGLKVKIGRLAQNHIKFSDFQNLAKRIERLDYSETYVNALNGVLANLFTNIGQKEDGSTLDFTRAVRGFIKNLIEIDSDKAFQEVIKLSWLTDFINPNDPEDIWSFISPRLDRHDVDRITKFALRWMGLAYQNKILYPDELMKEILKYTGMGSIFLVTNNILELTGGINFNRVSYTHFPAMFGGLPIPHCSEIEVVRSGKVVKFRATGSIFLALQEGGEDAIRVECVFVGEETIYILLLWVLFLFGRGDTREIQSMTNLTLNELIAIKDKLLNTSTINTTVQKPTYEYHRTLPFISRYFIIPNVYIETLSFEDRIIDGLDTVKVSMLLRTYTKPYKFVNHTIDETTGLMRVAQKRDNTLWQYRAVEYFANVAWRTVMAQGLAVQEQSWKKSGDFTTGILEGRDDVYYDVEASDIAQTAIFSGMGLL